jgi:hypothetical protein
MKKGKPHLAIIALVVEEKVILINILGNYFVTQLSYLAR